MYCIYISRVSPLKINTHTRSNCICTLWIYYIVLGTKQIYHSPVTFALRCLSVKSRLAGVRRNFEVERERGNINSCARVASELFKLSHRFIICLSLYLACSHLFVCAFSSTHQRERVRERKYILYKWYELFDWKTIENLRYIYTHIGVEIKNC